MPTPKLFTQDGSDYREFTDAEYAQNAVDKAANEALADAKAARTAAREALLTKLGITAAEAQLLLGGM